MNKKERVWWEALAVQYEEWAENPPINRYLDEFYTCDALQHMEEFGFKSHPHATGCLGRLWCPWFSSNYIFPAGRTYWTTRESDRFEFCWFMAEAIREYLKTGRGPWEVEQ